MAKKSFVFFFVFLILCLCNMEATASSIKPSVGAKSYVLVDPTSGRVLEEKRSGEKRAMASTTKIMTAIIALEKGNLKSKIIVSQKAATISGSSFGLSQGDTLSLGNMLYGLLLPSGNDAAIAIAEHVGGTEEDFVVLMNKKAVELGAFNTHFKNPHGLDEPGHFTTAKDLALIAKHALSIEKFREIVQTKSTEIKEGEFVRNVSNTNKLLWQYEGANGIKTGYTSKAEKCLVASAGKNFDLMSIVLGTNNHFSDSSNLLDYGFNNYEPKPFVYKNQYWATTRVDKGTKNEVDLMAKDSLDLLLMNNENVEVELVVPKSVMAPIVEGEEIGELQVYVNNYYAGSTPLIAMTNVGVKKYNNILHEFFLNWIKSNCII